jgi:hypothetical protein
MVLFDFFDRICHDSGKTLVTSALLLQKTSS